MRDHGSEPSEEAPRELVRCNEYSNNHPTCQRRGGSTRVVRFTVCGSLSMHNPHIKTGNKEEGLARRKTREQKQHIERPRSKETGYRAT